MFANAYGISTETWGYTPPSKPPGKGKNQYHYHTQHIRSFITNTPKTNTQTPSINTY